MIYLYNIKDQSQGHQRGGGAGKGPIGQTDKRTITNSRLIIVISTRRHRVYYRFIKDLKTTFQQFFRLQVNKKPNRYLVLRSSLNCYLSPKKGSQGHQIFFGHHQESPKGILAHGS